MLKSERSLEVLLARSAQCRGEGETEAWKGAESPYKVPSEFTGGGGWPGALTWLPGYGPGRLEAGGILLSSLSQLLADLSLHHCQILRFKF